MPRRRVIAKRRVLPDPKFSDVLVTKFMNVVIVYGAFDVVHGRTREDPIMIFRRAVDNAKPAVEVKSRRVGGSTYQVPVEVRSERQIALALRWIIENAQSRAGKSMDEKLANELIEASHNRGGAIKKKEDVHRMAEANKAFAHYRW
jgi:small subunit ribosomal protein S7